MSTNIGQKTLPKSGPHSDLKRAILDRIRRDKSIRVCTPNDFLDLGSRSAIDKTLQRLTRLGDIRRIDRGIYDLPHVNSLTGKPSTPDYSAIIDAIARREKARFLPDGITAANQLGLTDAVPAKVTIHTDARLRPIHLDRLVIDFKLTAPSRLYWAGHPAMRIVQALHWLHLDGEADEFMQFVADVKPTEDGSLQIMYGIDGRRELSESSRDDLSGYAGARPVRVGNAAFSQRQNDVFGAVLDSILLHTRRNERLPGRLWPIVESQAQCATRVWRDPDQGIWEARGKPQHYVSSKLMCWVALDRASALAEIRGDPSVAATWRSTAHEIRADVLAHGVSDRGVLRQHYETDALDASTLLAGSFKFLAHDDERLRNTVLAIAEELTENGFVLRYRTDETDDGLSGKEGTFVICSFWLVSALAIVGEMQRARDLMERLLRIASPLGLYAEEYDPETGRHLGNFPQAFSHLALIEAAARMIFLQRLAEF